MRTPLLSLLVLATAALAPAQDGPFRVVPRADPLGGDAPAAEPDTAEVGAALEWLAERQEDDGRWSAGEGDLQEGGDPGATALALLTYLGHGHTHRFGEHKRVVNEGLQWLKRQQAADGSVGWDDDAPAPALTHHLGAMALGEAYAVSRDFTLKRYAEKALERTVALQDADSGGWSLVPGAPADALATVYGVLALKTAKVGGIEVPDAAFAAASRFLEGLTDGQGWTGYREAGVGAALTAGDAEAPAVPLFTAGAYIARVFCGVRRSDGLLRAGVAHLDAAPPRADAAAPIYWHLGTYATFQAGNARFEEWASPMWAATGALEEDGFPATGLAGALYGETGTAAFCLLAREIVARYERASGGR